MVVHVGGRPPHGGRGLKFRGCGRSEEPKRSSSTWRTWIEIDSVYRFLPDNLPRPPCGGRGLKYGRAGGRPPQTRSSSTWRTWIEIQPSGKADQKDFVVLHMEDVD